MLRNATCQRRKSFITREFPQNTFGKEKKKKTTHHNLSSWSSFCRISEQSIPILSLVQLKYAELQIPSYFLFMYCVCLPSGN